MRTVSCEGLGGGGFAGGADTTYGLESAQQSARAGALAAALLLVAAGLVVALHAAGDVAADAADEARQVEGAGDGGGGAAHGADGAEGDVAEERLGPVVDADDGDGGDLRLVGGHAGVDGVVDPDLEGLVQRRDAVVADRHDDGLDRRLPGQPPQLPHPRRVVDPHPLRVPRPVVGHGAVVDSAPQVAAARPRHRQVHVGPHVLGHAHRHALADGLGVWGEVGAHLEDAGVLHLVAHIEQLLGAVGRHVGPVHAHPVHVLLAQHRRAVGRPRQLLQRRLCRRLRAQRARAVGEDVDDDGEERARRVGRHGLAERRRRRAARLAPLADGEGGAEDGGVDAVLLHGLQDLDALRVHGRRDHERGEVVEVALQHRRLRQERVHPRHLPPPPPRAGQRAHVTDSQTARKSRPPRGRKRTRLTDPCACAGAGTGTGARAGYGWEAGVGARAGAGDGGARGWTFEKKVRTGRGGGWGRRRTQVMRDGGGVGVEWGWGAGGGGRREATGCRRKAGEGRKGGADEGRWTGRRG